MCYSSVNIERTKYFSDIISKYIQPNRSTDPTAINGLKLTSESCLNQLNLQNKILSPSHNLS